MVHAWFCKVHGWAGARAQVEAAEREAAAKGLKEEQEGAEEEERSLQVHEATALCPSAPAGLFKLSELGPSDIETRERGASLQPGQLVSATSSDLLRLSAAGDVSDEKMGWHRSPPLSRCNLPRCLVCSEPFGRSLRYAP